MKYLEFRKNLRKHRISLKNLSSILEISYGGIQNWKHIGIPKYAIEFLNLLEKLSAEEREKYLREKLIIE